MRITRSDKCSPDKLYAMNRMSSKPQFSVGQILNGAASLGLLGASAHSGPRLIAILCNPQISARETVDLIRTEPAIHLRILRVANSTYYGQMRSVTTIDRALVLLGLDAVRGIAAAVCVGRTMARGGTGPLVDLTALLHHGLAAATAAESLAGLTCPARSADAFIAGLLHNLGTVVQMHLDAPGMRSMIAARSVGAGRDMRALESMHAAVGHEECAATIFEAWQLPDALVAAARHHHEPSEAPGAHRELTALVNLGANLALASGHTFALESDPGVRDSSAVAQLGLSDADMNHVEASLPQRMGELRGALGL
jgi:HD-like signal output (HDOD) protein